MTCRALGGPCDFEHHGESADDVINAQDRHLKEAEKAGDATHQEARDAMKSRWRHPMKSMGWYRDTKRAFAALSDDDTASGPRFRPAAQTRNETRQRARRRLRAQRHERERRSGR
ncbi:MAG: hypothetical protein WKF76_13400 [Nocardioidaceae bacterium]